MPAPQADRDAEVDRALRHALTSVPYPTPVQRAEARASVLALAARQVPLPAQTPSLASVIWLRVHHAIIPVLRRMLTDDSVYDRVKAGSYDRPVSLQYSPSVYFQPMW